MYKAPLKCVFWFWLFLNCPHLGVLAADDLTASDQHIVTIPMLPSRDGARRIESMSSPRHRVTLTEPAGRELRGLPGLPL